MYFISDEYLEIIKILHNNNFIQYKEVEKLKIHYYTDPSPFYIIEKEHSTIIYKDKMLLKMKSNIFNLFKPIKTININLIKYKYKNANEIEIPTNSTQYKFFIEQQPKIKLSIGQIKINEILKGTLIFCKKQFRVNVHEIIISSFKSHLEYNEESFLENLVSLLESI